MDERTLVLAVLQRMADFETEEGDKRMRLPWTDERDSIANEHYYAADVLKDAIDEVNAHSANPQQPTGD